MSPDIQQIRTLLSEAHTEWKRGPGSNTRALDADEKAMLAGLLSLATIAESLESITRALHGIASKP